MRANVHAHMQTYRLIRLYHFLVDSYGLDYR